MEQATTLEQLKTYAGGVLVELPPFGYDQPFKAIMKRPSLMRMAESGQIPDSLMQTAEELFTGKQSNVRSTISSKENMTQILELCETMAEASLVSPTYSQLKEAGVQLTDDQFMFIFNYTQKGVAALRSFPTKPEGYKPDRNE